MNISITIPTRNDGFSGNTVETTALCLEAMSHSFSDVILVDFGSVSPMAPLLQEKIKERPGTIRIITVPKNWVVGKLLDDTTFADVLARNIGLRRSKYDIMVSSNSDIIPAAIHRFDFSKFDENIFYSSNKFMIEKSLVLTMRSQGKNWNDIQEHLFNTRNSYFRQPGYAGDPWSKVSGCGDFQIGHRKIWFNAEVRGFEENLRYQWYADTNLHKKIIENAKYDVQSALFFYVFHMSHNPVTGARKNDLHESVFNFNKTMNLETWGFSQDNFEETII